jgi:hypothetical protein
VTSPAVALDRLEAGERAASGHDVALPALRAPSPALEFLVTGGGTLVLLPLCWVLERGLGLDRSELLVGFLTFHGAHLINDPHFAVTYVLFYRKLRARLRDGALPVTLRARYALAGFVAPVLLLGWAFVGIALKSAPAIGALTQLMFVLVGWHYVKQAFGVMSVLSSRRGVRFSAFERRALLAHCFCGWAYGWASPFDPGRSVEEKGVVYSTWAQPHWLEPLTAGLLALSSLWLALSLLLKWRRERRLPWAPLVGMLSAVWFWTVLSGIDPLFMYLIPALHSLQYLYFVWLLKRTQARAHEGPPDFGRPVASVLGALAVSALALGVVLFHWLPGSLDALLIDARQARFTDLGPTPYFAALFAVVNLHHYFMDNAIWRRDEPEMQYLR